MTSFPVAFTLSDGTKVVVNKTEDHLFDFHLTRLNSSKYNFSLNDETDEIISVYSSDIINNASAKEEKEAIELFKEKVQ